MREEDTEGWTSADGSADPDSLGEHRPTDSDPSADPGDEFFAVLDSDVVRALVDVHDRGLDDALVFVEEGHGMVTRNSGGENCYWVQTEISADDFEVFQATDVETSLGIPALSTALDRARRGERISLHYSDEEGFRLGVGTDRHPIGGNEPELSEELRDRDAFSTVTGDAIPEIRFEIDASRFQALVGVESDHSHVRVASDTQDRAVSFSFVGHPGGGDSVDFEIPVEDLVSPPEDTGWGADEHDGVEDLVTSSSEDHDEETVETAVDIFEDELETATSYVCTDSVIPAMSPMRGPVRVLHSDGRHSTRFTYERADGTLAVKALVSHRLDEVEDLP